MSSENEWGSGGVDFEVTADKTHGADSNKYCWSAYWRNNLIGRGWARTRLGTWIGIRLYARQWRVAIRSVRTEAEA